MKSLYIVDYWVPFPQSEYGGVVNLIAGSDAEAFELCADDDELGIPGYEDRIMPNILRPRSSLCWMNMSLGLLMLYHLRTMTQNVSIGRVTNNMGDC